MNTAQKIAKRIAVRGRRMGWKPGTKTADKLNIECWAGAAAALGVTEAQDADHVLRIAVMLIAPRGYAETLRIAEEVCAQDKEAC